MSRKSQMILVISISLAVWVAGVFLLYKSFSTPRVERISASFVATVKDVELDPRTGQFVEKSFVESKANEPVGLTLLCGAACVVAILRAFRKQHEEENQLPRS